MVFILGKSGSGKSTLLNVIGGLDKYDEGDFIIKNKSSKEFKQKDFDSYRNTMIGFIFQEYNILDEFTVAQNIGLALQLQGKQLTNEAINEILESVDLEGYGSRKPNELSGGQKQRVAIARALVKDPEIIMADEPTGALDSDTGKQVFETLKKLSKEKLVIVVSHDREFAEKYGSRIIEFKDGKIIRDVSKSYDEKREETPSLTFTNEGFNISEGYQLTVEDLNVINQFLAKGKKSVKVNTHLSTQNKNSDVGFIPTNQENIEMKDETYEPIRSRLPFSVGLKMGASALKHKRIRLVFSILLASIAFVLFGLADTLGSYNKYDVAARSLIDSKVDYLSFNGQKIVDRGEYKYYTESNINDEQISELNGINPNIEFLGITTGDNGYGYTDYYSNIYSNVNSNIYSTRFSGYLELTEEVYGKLDYKFLGTKGNIPKEKNEIVVTEYIYEVFKKYGYKDNLGNSKVEIKNYEDLIDKEIMISENIFKVVGILDTNLDLERYRSLDDSTQNENISKYILSNEFNNVLMYSFHNVFFVNTDTFNSLSEYQYEFEYNSPYLKNQSDNYYIRKVANISNLNDSEIIFYEGYANEKLGKNDIIITSGIASSLQIYDYENNFKEPISLEFGITDNYSDKGSSSGQTVRIVGILKDEGFNWDYNIYISDELAADMDLNIKGRYNYVTSNTGVLSKSELLKFINLHYAENTGFKFNMRNAVTATLDNINSMIEGMAQVFFYIGIGFAVFASLLLLNFISASVANKKQEIGILRAIGARGKDVLSIFTKEATIIALINYVIAMIGVIGLVFYLNTLFRTDYGILITILSLGIRQVLLVLAVSLAVAYISAAIPVFAIARKRPIDAIRDK